LKLFVTPAFIALFSGVSYLDLISTWPFSNAYKPLVLALVSNALWFIIVNASVNARVEVLALVIPIILSDWISPVIFNEFCSIASISNWLGTSGCSADVNGFASAWIWIGEILFSVGFSIWMVYVLLPRGKLTLLALEKDVWWSYGFTNILSSQWTIYNRKFYNMNQDVELELKYDRFEKKVASEVNMIAQEQRSVQIAQQPSGVIESVLQVGVKDENWNETMRIDQNEDNDENSQVADEQEEGSSCISIGESDESDAMLEPAEQNRSSRRVQFTNSSVIPSYPSFPGSQDPNASSSASEIELGNSALARTAFDGIGAKRVTFVVTTMWREAADEMLGTIDSYRQLIPTKKRDQYFEVHIVIDSAESRDRTKWNEYASYLISNVGMLVEKCDTFYGQCRHYRLYKKRENSEEFEGNFDQLPLEEQRELLEDEGYLNIFVHMKDSTMVQNKKRWSQILYLQILKQRVLSLAPAHEPDLKSAFALLRNSFLLMTDGDTLWGRKDVEKLHDWIIRDARVCGASGRVKPIGPGPISWYQK
jgi:hypothetical protein